MRLRHPLLPLACGLLLAPSTAAAQADLALAEASVTAEGEVVVDFRGDPATCLTSANVCDREGTVAWRPRRRLSLVAFLGPSGRVDTLLFAERGETAATTTARVRRTGGTGTCTDTVDTTVAGVTLSGRPGALRVRVGASVDLLPTRCGGPLTEDVAGALPARTVTLRDLRRGATTIDLAADAPFTAGGLTGRVRSTLRLRVGRLRAQDDPEPDVRATPGGEIEARFRVTEVRGGVTADVRGEGATAPCAPLDACGASGTLVLSPRAGRGSGTLSVSLPARSRVRGLVPALRRARRLDAGGRGITAFGYVGWRERGVVGSTLRGPSDVPCPDDAPCPTVARELPCTDEAPLPAGSLTLEPAGGRVRASYSPSAWPRTRCPGPLLATPLAQPALATGTVPASAFARRRVTFRLLRGARVKEGPYTARTRSDLTVVLRRTSLRTRIVREPVP
jgi:hypothetical protein